jgi:hypothetical protein
VSEEPEQLHEERFFEFVAGPAPSVVFVSLHRMHTFNASLPERMSEAGLPETVFGRLEYVEMCVAPRVLGFLAHAMSHRGSPVGILPGYYLFLEGELLAYDSGLPARDDVGQLLRGAVFGAALYRVTGHADHLLQAMLSAASGAACRRAARSFAQAVQARRVRPRASARPAADTGEAELFWAYRTLGVKPGASDAEVNRAWRKLRLAHHPDHAVSDPEEFARRSLRSRELNHARDVIFAHRARGAGGQRRAS